MRRLTHTNIDRKLLKFIIKSGALWKCFLPPFFDGHALITKFRTKLILIEIRASDGMDSVCADENILLVGHENPVIFC